MLERLGSLSPTVHRVILLVGCVILFGIWIMRMPLLEPDETRYTEATREMFITHNFMIPQYNFEPRYAKPILYYWVQAAAIKTFGLNEISVRLPSAIFATLLVLILYGFLLRWLTSPAMETSRITRAQARGAAFLGGAALATTPLIAIWARGAVTDITLTFFITLSLLSLLQAELERKTEQQPAGWLSPARRWYLLAMLFSGLAFLTKGPMGVALPLMVWVFYHLRQRTLLEGVRAVPWVSGILLFLAVTAPWYLGTYFFVGPAFLQRFFIGENVGRFGGSLTGHGIWDPDYFTGLLTYLPQAVACLFPYSAFLLRELASPFSRNESLLNNEAVCCIRRFALTWLLVILGFFAISSVRYPNYFQSVSGAAAILFAVHLLGRYAPGTKKAQDGEEEPEPRRLAPQWAINLENSVLLGIGAIFVILPPAVLLLMHTAKRRPWDAAFAQPARDIVLVILLACGTFFLISAVMWVVRRQPARLVGWLMAGWALVLGVLLLGFAPIFFSSSFAPVEDVGRYVRPLPSNIQVYAFCPKDPPEDIVFYGRRKVTFFDSRKQEDTAAVKMALAAQPNILLVTDKAGLAALSDAVQLTVVKEFDYFVLARVEKGQQ